MGSCPTASIASTFRYYWKKRQSGESPQVQMLIRIDALSRESIASCGEWKLVSHPLPYPCVANFCQLAVCHSAEQLRQRFREGVDFAFQRVEMMADADQIAIRALDDRDFDSPFPEL